MVEAENISIDSLLKWITQYTAKGIFITTIAQTHIVMAISVKNMKETICFFQRRSMGTIVLLRVARVPK